MSYRLTAAEREFQVSICDDEDELCITSSSPYYARRILKIAEAMGREVKRLGNGETIRVYLPKKCLSLKVPRTLSDEQKTALAERMKQTRAAVSE
jgi:hypothetical protein